MALNTHAPVGVGLQRIGSNLVSGLYLLISKPVRPGDVIALSGGTAPSVAGPSANGTWATAQAISRRPNVQGVVVTLAEHGCEIWQGGERTLVPGVAAECVVDPTGCGDAFRAALLYGLERGWPLQRCAVLGNRLGALKIARRGPQNHVLDAEVQALLVA